MELKEFIQKTLSDIVDGTTEAQKKLGGRVAVCQNKDVIEYRGFPTLIDGSRGRRVVPLTIVEFNVQVEVQRTLSADGEVTAEVIKLLNGGISGEATRTSGNAQEVSFSLPLAWMQQ